MAEMGNQKKCVDTGDMGEGFQNIAAQAFLEGGDA
jgi:hypothetical protein